MYCNNHVGEQTYRDVTWPNDFNNVYAQNQNLIISIDPGFIDLFTPMAESHISSGPYFVDVDGPGKESGKGTKKKPERVKADSRPSPVQLLFFERITAHNSSPFFCLQMQSQNKVCYQICECTLLLKCLS